MSMHLSFSSSCRIVILCEGFSGPHEGVAEVSSEEVLQTLNYFTSYKNSRGSF